MDLKANPIPNQGKRNIYCPYYSDCLDYAIKFSWESWDCSQCPHKFIEQLLNEYEYQGNLPDPYYDLPPNLARGIGHDSFD